MDIKAKIDEIVSRLRTEPDLLATFKKDPIKTVEGIVGVDLPDDQIKGVIDGVKARVFGEGTKEAEKIETQVEKKLDKADGEKESIIDKVKDLFN